MRVILEWRLSPTYRTPVYSPGDKNRPSSASGHRCPMVMPTFLPSGAEVHLGEIEIGVHGRVGVEEPGIDKLGWRKSPFQPGFRRKNICNVPTFLVYTEDVSFWKVEAIALYRTASERLKKDWKSWMRNRSGLTWPSRKTYGHLSWTESTSVSRQACDGGASTVSQRHHSRILDRGAVGPLVRCPAHVIVLVATGRDDGFVCDA
jgi:hypothetical protein